MTRTPRTTTIPRAAALHLSTRALVAFVLAAFFARRKETAQRNGSGRRGA